MADVRKAVLAYICVLALGFVLGGWTVYTIAEGRYSGEINKLSAGLARSEELNRQLDSANVKLIDSNTRARAEVARLEQQLARDRKDFDARIGRIKTTVADISGGLSGSADSIQGVIDGLRELGTLIEALP